MMGPSGQIQHTIEQELRNLCSTNGTYGMNGLKCLVILVVAIQEKKIQGCKNRMTVKNMEHKKITTRKHNTMKDGIK